MSVYHNMETYHHDHYREYEKNQLSFESNDLTLFIQQFFVSLKNNKPNLLMSISTGV